MTKLIPKLLRALIVLCGLLCTVSCTNQEDSIEADAVEKLLSINGGSETYTVNNAEKTGWQITACPE